MICRSVCAEPCAVETRLCCSGVSSVWPRTSSIPVTPIMGVRISWLMAATNVDFARFASSAAARACRASRSATSRRTTSDWTAVAMALNAEPRPSSSDTPPAATRRS